ATGGIIGIQTGSTVANFFPGLMACSDNVPDRIAVTVDAQLDDIRPATGQIRALKQTGPAGAPPPLASSTPVTDYIEDGSRYTLCRQL
ncbi:MAG: hypothetical protein ABIU95_04050, partial [Burkholderiales bacterium]